ncbi:glutathione S-transferase family protein [Actibacterium sp.]|uniref:glutathione S-transferase family protein n=1 Tax=Actibacterium sp. TaxID=1872125 RepID=UPI00356ADFCC
MTLTLFHAANACSLGIAFLLEEIGVPYRAHVLNLQTKENRDPEFLALNPKGKVPALLRSEGGLLTEFPAIAYWLARRFPEAGLFSDDLEEQTRMIEALEFIVGSVHMRGFTLFRVPQKFVPDAKAQDDLRVFGRAETQAGLAILSDRLGDKPFMFGKLSIVDAAMFYNLRWAVQENLNMPKNLHDLYARLSARPGALAADALIPAVH